MSQFPGHGPGMPGMGSIDSTESRKFLTNNTHLVYRGAKIDADSVDAGHSGKTTTLRAGLVVVQVLTGPNAGKYVPHGHADCPDNGDIEAAGILMDYTTMLDKDRNAADQPAHLLIHGFVKESAVIFGTGDAGFISAVKDLLPLVMWEQDVPQP